MLLKKLIFTLIFAVVFSFSVYSADEPNLSAECAVLINAETLEVIFKKNADKSHSMASTTKIMTALLALESGRLGETVTARNLVTEGTSIGLKDGYKLSLEALTWGMLLESGNDAAKLTADFLAGSEENFALLMNEKADKIGMTSTNFVTASGLDSSEHYSTAYDMALLGAYAVKNPLFREICSAKSKTVRFIKPDISLTFYNHNRLLSSCEGVFGIKTGFTKKSGRCLVSACLRQGVTLVAVTLNAGDDWNDHKKLYDYGYDKTVTESACLRLPESIKVYGGNKNTLAITADEERTVYSYSGEKGEIRQKLYLKEFLYAPIKKGEIVGKAVITRNGKKIAETEITAAHDISAAEPVSTPTLWERIYNRIIDIFR